MTIAWQRLLAVLREADGGGAAPVEKPAAAPAPAAPAAAAPPADAGKDAATGDKPAAPAPAADAGNDDGGDQSVEGTLLADADGEDKPAAHPADWPQDWRERMLAGIKDEGAREKAGKTASRYKSPADVFKALQAAQQKISSGEFKKDYPADGTPEEQAAWRKDRGIPEKPDGYEIPDEIEGLKLTEADQPNLELALSELHAINADQKTVNHVLGLYGKMVQREQEAIRQRDAEFREQSENAIRTELGDEYKPAMQLYLRTIKDPDIFPDNFGEMLAGARLPDGNRLINHPTFAKFMLDIGKERYGDAALIPSNQMSQMQSREDELVKIMNTDISKMHREKNTKGQSLWDELMDLRRARDRTTKKR